MSAIFISHSSIDKPFVRKLAVDLLQEGMPVWLDEWELDIGDSLVERIYGGIDAGTYFVLVISKASLASGWVAKELTAALVKEEQLSRRFLIPILLDESRPPLQVADRLYSDFSKGYLVAFERLAKRLKAEGVHKIVPSRDRIVIPLSFVQDTHLDTAALKARIEHLRPVLLAERPLEPKDLYVCTSPEYGVLREKIVYRMEHIKEDSFYSPDFELGFKDYYRSTIDLERKYADGICLILNNGILAQNAARFDPYEAAKWFSRFWRSAILARLHNAQNPNDQNLLDYGSKCLNDCFGSDCASYGLTQTLCGMDVGPANGQRMGDAFRVYIDREQEAYSDTQYCTIERLSSYGGPILSKYVVPQMVANMVEDFDGPYSWNFDGYGIGRA